MSTIVQKQWNPNCLPTGFQNVVYGIQNGVGFSWDMDTDACRIFSTKEEVANMLAVIRVCKGKVNPIRWEQAFVADIVKVAAARKRSGASEMKFQSLYSEKIPELLEKKGLHGEYDQKSKSWTITW